MEPITLGIIILNFGTHLKNESFGFGGVGAVGNRFGNKSKIQWHCPGSGPEYAEISREPLDAVHHQMNDAIALLYPSCHQGLSYGVGLAVEGFPRDFDPAVFFGFAFDQGGLPAIHSSVAGQNFSYQHRDYLSLATLKKLLELAQSGANVIFEKKIPQKVPGFSDYKTKESEIEKLIKSLNFELEGNISIAKYGEGSILSGNNIN